jgi:transcriptional/translational regulatory protein YebC/TACO1
MGESGSVSNFAFEYKGHIVVEEPTSREDLELAIMESPAEDYEMSETITIYTKREDLIETKTRLEKSGYTIRESGM